MSGKHAESSNPYSALQHHRESAGSAGVQHRAAPAAAGTAVRPSRSPYTAGGGGKLSKGGKTALIAAGAVVLFLLIVFLCMGFYVRSLDTIYPNVTFSGVNVGGLTLQQAADKLTNSNISADQEKVTVKLTDDVSVVVTAADAGLLPGSAADAAQVAYEYGREGGFVSDLRAYLRCSRKGAEVATSSMDNFNETAVRQLISDAAAKADAKAAESAYKVTDTQIQITKGATGVVVDQDALYTLVQKAFQDGNYGTLEYTVQKTEPKAIDLDAIYKAVTVEMKNSVYDTATGAGTEAVKGVTFDLDKAKQLYASAKDGETVTLDLVVTEPEITKEQLDAALFRDVLGEKMTTMYSSSSARLNNITLAAKAINGTVLNPGEEFSYNNTLGERTAAKGYQAAGAYVGGQTVDQIGGGICQCSSTLYYCALLSDLEITDRSGHMYAIAYLPLGTDATVNWGSIDFKFKNSRDYPIKIVAYVSNAELYVQILGTNTDGSSIKITNNVFSTTPFDTVYEETTDLSPGVEKVKTTGYTGYKAEAFKNYYDANGNLLKTVSIGTTTYSVRNKVIQVGKAAETSSAETSSAETSTETSGETSSAETTTSAQ